MEGVIGPGHPLYDRLQRARQGQGGEVVELMGSFYNHYNDSGSEFFVLIPTDFERDTLGVVSRMHRGWYPPIIKDDE